MELFSGAPVRGGGQGSRRCVCFILFSALGYPAAVELCLFAVVLSIIVELVL